MSSPVSVSVSSELVLNKNLTVAETRSFQMDYLLRDMTYSGTDGSVLLHFNVTILPVAIAFSNSTYVFSVSRKATMLSKVPYSRGSQPFF